MEPSFSVEADLALPFNPRGSLELYPTNVSAFEKRMEHSEEIHSGHYMVSNIDDSESETEDAALCLDETSRDAMETSNSKDKNWLEFEDLASLFRYLEIAYTGQLTSPKWNQFRGLRFAVKNKIRLNNIIWREYHMQFIKKVRPFIVQFQAPVTENHSKPEAIVMEGKYWKRRLSTVCQEYRSWRLFAKNKIHGPNQKYIMSCVEDLLGPPNYALQKAHDDLTGSLAFCDNEDCTFSPAVFPDDIMMDFDENLNLFFEQPLTFPNPKDLALLGIGDIMQPGLLQFEPNSASPTEEIGPPLYSTTGGPSKLGKRVIHEPRTIQESPTEMRREPLIGGPEEPNKRVFQTGGRDITMKSVAPGIAKRELFRRNPPAQSLVIQPPNASASRTPVGSNTFTYEPLPEMPHSSVEECLPSVSLSPRVQIDCSLNKISTVKYSAGQPHSCTIRRPYTVKHFPASVLHKHRCSVPNTVHSNDKTLKQMFRNGYLDSTSVDQDHSKGTSSSPALLNALLHGPEVQKKPGGLSTVDGHSAQPNEVQNNCSVPLLCSALTAPLSSSSRHQAGLLVPNRQSDFLPVSHLVESQRPVMLGATSCLITDSLRPSEELHTMPVECSHGDFKSDSADPTVFPTVMIPSDQDTYSTSILKSTLTSPQATITDVALVPSVPHVLRTNNSDPNTEANFFKSGAFVDETPSTNQNRYTIVPDRHVSRAPETRSANFLHPLFKSKTVDPRPVHHQSDMDGVNFVGGAHPAQSLSIANAPNLVDRLGSGFTQTQFSLFPAVPSVCDPVHRKHSPVRRNRDPSVALTLSSAQSTWPEAPAPSDTSTLDSQYWSRTTIKGHQPENFMIAINTPEQTMVINKEESEGLTFAVESAQSLSTRGRSSSAGNLFPLPQPMHNYVAKPSSSTTMSSYGSTEILSPPVSSQSNFLCMSSPSCSPPPPALIDSDLSSRHTAGNSSEEIRRQSMHAALQTLRRLVHMHSNLDGPAGGGRLAARRLMDLHDYRASAISSRGLDDIDDDAMPNWLRPKGSSAVDGTGTDAYTVGTSESVGTYKATKAATLRGAAELIRGMREQRNALDAQQNSLRSEMETLKKAISTWCGKMTPSGPTPSRPVCDPYLQDRSEAWFRYYVQKRTEQCWKFYVFSLILGELFQSYCATVNTTSREHFMRSLFGWLDQHASLGHFRMAAPRAMCRLSTTTSILRDPSLLPEQAKRAAAEMTTIGLDSPTQMHVDPNEKLNFDTFSTNKITT
ncbi:MLX-interacting protein [Fasciola gigantica]|uniref:MLX-interacting protein n=1 Tax=Fasciola gigantica TaxID=46835 RepID=A0A504YK32_FASGI|nr:MLX-interacting protein [Fasciola gigantica]